VVTFHPGNKVLFAGNSLTQFGWMTVAGGLVDQVNAQLGASVSVGSSSGSVGSSSGSVAAVTAPSSALNVINRGVAGWSSVQIAADAPNVVALHPDIVVLDIGINDPPLGISAADYRTNVDSALATYITGGIGQILVVSPLVFGELRTSDGTAFSGNGFDSQTDDIVAQAQASAAAHGATFINIRVPALAYIDAHGPPAPGTSFGTLVDSSEKHPIVPTGQLWMSNEVMTVVAVGP
jgi:lysophospholipase L1-like esterase